MVAARRQKHSLIYIMGDGRSGSTIASIVLGNHPSISSNGELHKWALFKGYPKWDNKKEEDHRFWEAVRAYYLKRGFPSDFAYLEGVQDKVEEYIRFPELLLHRTPPETLSTYYAYVLGLVEAIEAVSDKEIVVDETKRPGRGYALLRCQDIDMRIIHIVRDPRGVLWSSKKRDVEHPYKSPLTAAMHYSIKNLMCLIVQRLAPSGTVLRVRYEDLVTRPEVELRRIGGFLGLSMEPILAKIEAGDPLKVPCLLDANRIRHETEIRLRLDDAWRSRLGLGNRLIAVLGTLPFFLLFGYWNYPYEG
jgi:Sulfotransferase family